MTGRTPVEGLRGGGFSAEWLALREEADSAARARALVARLGAAWTGPREIVDLASGAGANLRYLAPLLGGPQDWLLVDVDETLLARAHLRPAERASPPHECRIRRVGLDLARDLAALAVPPGGLVTASALLDLVSRPWLEALIERCACAGAQVLFALTYDGRIELDPPEPEDDAVRALVNRHQLLDKGFGAALGPAAGRAAADAFAAAGYDVVTAPSDWRLGPADTALQRALLDGWLQAAAELEPAEGARLAAWRRRRERHIAAGRAAALVGHIDLLGLRAAQ